MIPADAIDVMRRRVPNLKDVVLVPGAGNISCSREEPQAVNQALPEVPQEPLSATRRAQNASKSCGPRQKAAGNSSTMDAPACTSAGTPASVASRSGV